MAEDRIYVAVDLSDCCNAGDRKYMATLCKPFLNRNNMTWLLSPDSKESLYGKSLAEIKLKADIAEPNLKLYLLTPPYLKTVPKSKEELMGRLTPLK